MRDAGLEMAIRAAGGVGALARRIGIAQPSVSNWSRIPAERVVSVESVTGVDRRVLRPDLYGADLQETNLPQTHLSPNLSGTSPTTAGLDDVETARAIEYGLLANLLARAPDRVLLERLSGLRADPSPLGMAHAALADAASRIDAVTIEREYFNLFIGLGRGDLLPYGSYYLSGFLHERPLARLRADLRLLGIERVEGQCEPEDHAAILCEIMAGLIDGRLPAEPGADRKVFDAHMVPWIGRFFADLERADSADFYRHVGTLGRTFIEIESEAFALPA